MADKLPRFIVLKSPRNDKYLIHRQDVDNDLQFSGTDFSNLHVKYQVVPSSKEDGLVHLKCCYNSKYWVCRPNSVWVRAEAREMEEDKSKWSCTLFKPVFFTSNRIGFCHIHIKKNVMFNNEQPFDLYVGDSRYEGDHIDFFDWESLPILPRFIRLKDKEGNYLSACKADQYYDKISNTVTDILEWVNPIYRVASEIVQATDDKNVYLCFNCKVKGDQTVGNEVFITPDNKIRLRNNHTGKFWRLSPSWIWPDTKDETNHPDTLFEVVKMSHNKISLKNMGNDMYCQRFTADRNKKDCLNANSSTTTEWTTFEVEELVDKRSIFNVRFHHNAARIYDEEIMCKVSSTDLNNTEEAFQATLEFEYTKEESRSWTTSNELKQTAEIEITASVPEVVDGKLKYAREVTETVTDGKTLNVKTVTKFTRTVTVPPNSKVVANFRVTHALCEVPYSYNQTEISSDGKPSGTQTRDDGLYKSVLTEVHFNPKQEKISS